MKKFLIQIGAFLCCLLFLILAVFYMADGYTDPMYLKFTTPKQSSLIIGTSKAAHGIHPKVINQILEREDVYNYGFTIVHSPFGPAYLKSIKNKLKMSTTDGVFIITVDPYSISSKTGEPDDTLNFSENEKAVGEIENVTSYPNFNYLIFHYPEQYIYILTRKIKYVSQGFLHDDGLVETGLSTDPKLVEERTEEKIINYTEQTKHYEFSEIRLNYLVKTVNFLKQHGNVYIVRLPVVMPLLKLENSIIPDFDQKINKICQKYNLNYLNLTKKVEDYSYDDGNHLDMKSGKIVSKEIAEWIKALK